MITRRATFVPFMKDCKIKIAEMRTLVRNRMDIFTAKKSSISVVPRTYPCSTLQARSRLIIPSQLSPFVSIPVLLFKYRGPETLICKNLIAHA